MNGKDYTMHRKGGASVQFAGPVCLRKGGSRTILGQSYRPGQSYSPDDPGVMAKPLFFVLATDEAANRKAAPKPKAKKKAARKKPAVSDPQVPE